MIVILVCNDTLDSVYRVSIVVLCTVVISDVYVEVLGRINVNPTFAFFIVYNAVSGCQNVPLTDDRTSTSSTVHASGCAVSHNNTQSCLEEMIK